MTSLDTNASDSECQIRSIETEQERDVETAVKPSKKLKPKVY